jgi:hypothetical protein
LRFFKASIVFEVSNLTPENVDHKLIERQRWQGQWFQEEQIRENENRNS